MVVTAQHLASEVGADILRRGGNAVDAAVAVGYALAVTHPCCGNLGGGGFMTIHLADGRNTFINFREKAPLAARADMFLDAHGNPVGDKSLNGYLAAGVPGTVLGLETARQEYGTLPRAVLMAAAIRLAQDGFILTRGDVDELEVGSAEFRGQPNVAAIFLHQGAPFKPGERLVQKELAATLRAISEGGAHAFYQGAIAGAVAASAHAHGGLLTARDFAAYTVTESAPISCKYRGFTILSAPPPSSGGVALCEMLQVLEAYPLEGTRLSLRRIGASDDRGHAARLSRPQHLPGRPCIRRQSHCAHCCRRSIPRRFARRFSRIARPRRRRSAVGAAAAEKATTTHYSVVDARRQCRIGHLHHQR